MPPKVKSSKSSSTVSDEVALAQAINKFSSATDALEKVWNTVNEQRKHMIENWELETHARKRRVEEEAAEYERAKQQRKEDFERETVALKHELDLQVRKHGLTLAEKVATEQGLVLVDKSKYKHLQKELHNLRESYSADLEAQVAEVKKSAKTSAFHEANSLKLQHKAEVAKFEAEKEQHASLVESLRGEVDRTHAELDKMRELMATVSENMKPAPVTVNTSRT